MELGRLTAAWYLAYDLWKERKDSRDYVAMSVLFRVVTAIAARDFGIDHISGGEGWNL